MTADRPYPEAAVKVVNEVLYSGAADEDYARNIVAALEAGGWLAPHLTDDDLAEIEERWVKVPAGMVCLNRTFDTVGNTSVWRDDELVAADIEWDTAEAIAHAPTDVAHLLAAYRTTRARLAEIEGQRDTWQMRAEEAEEILGELKAERGRLRDSGVRYCITHDGIVDVDQDACDNRHDLLDDEQADCVLRRLKFDPEETATEVSHVHGR